MTLSNGSELARAREMRLNGSTVREIARATGLSRSTVGRTVRGLNVDAHAERVIDRWLEVERLYLAGRSHRLIAAAVGLSPAGVEVALRSLGTPRRRYTSSVAALPGEQS